MSKPGMYQRLRRDLPDYIYRFFFDLYERDRWERAVSRVWYRCRVAGVCK